MTRGFWGCAVMAGLVCFSCGTDEPAGGGADEAGAAGAGESMASSGASHGGEAAGGGGATESTAGTPGSAGAGGGSACEGDAALWATITAAPPECETADDCCVVVNSCLAEAQIVHADDFEAAQAAWPYCADECTDCIPPVVTVACDNGHCVGTSDPDSVEDSVSHCGDTAAMGDEPAQAFSCGD